jgi:type III secretion protein D
MTKQFRILTGCHAGARLNLRYGISTVGSNEQADVQISDWEGETMFLEFCSDGTVTMTPPPGNASSPRLVQTLLDWVPRRHGQTVFCVGPADAEWPSEVSLFEKLLQQAQADKDSAESAKVMAMNGATQATGGGRPSTIQGKGHSSGPNGALKKRWAYSGGAVAVVGMIVGLMLVLTDGSSEKARAAIRPVTIAPVPVLSAAQQQVQAQDKAIQAALLHLHQTNVTVARADGRIMLGGIVASAADALAIRRALHDLSSAPHSSIANVTIDQSFSVADTISDDLQSTLNDTGLTVRYAGNGVFTVAGVTHNLAGTRALLARAQNDYGGRIRRIEDQMTQASTPSNGAEAMLDADGVKYIQMPDGSKSFAPDPTPTTPATPFATVAPVLPATLATANASSVTASASSGPAESSHAAAIKVKSMATPLASTALPPGEAPLPSQP